MWVGCVCGCARIRFIYKNNTYTYVILYHYRQERTIITSALYPIRIYVVPFGKQRVICILQGELTDAYALRETLVCSEIPLKVTKIKALKDWARLSLFSHALTYTIRYCTKMARCRDPKAVPDVISPFPSKQRSCTCPRSCLVEV